MAKIKIKKLPEGFEFKDGKIVEKKVMKDGGMYMTGDQADYGLVTTPQEFYGDTNFNNTRDNSVRYSLSKVPRDNANIEAEGGETVLTDLNDDGMFGLYDIKGPRHSQGGVPMFLPDQSFIYSDTGKLRLTKNEMKEFDLGGARKTPAAVSKKFPLNPYYAELDSQYADDISSRSAELMLKKNMEDLSKLGFLQEAKKGFSDGVPLVSHPYLFSQGINPIDFTARVEGITAQQAQENVIGMLPQSDQDKLLAIQEMLVAAEQQKSQQDNMVPQVSQSQMDLVNANNAIMPMAEQGTEMFGNGMRDFLMKAQEGNGENKDNDSFRNTFYTINGTPVDREQFIDYTIRTNLHRGLDGKIDEGFIKSLTKEEILKYGKNLNDIPEDEYDWFKGASETVQGDLSITEEVFNEKYGDLENNPSATGVNDIVQDNVNAALEESRGVRVNNNTSTRRGSLENPSFYFPEGSDQANKIKQLQEQGYTFSIEDGKLKAFRPMKGTNLESGEAESIEISGRGEGTQLYSDDISTQGSVFENLTDEDGNPIGRYRKGIFSDVVLPKVQDPTGAAYGSKEILTERAEKDFMERWGDVVGQIEGFDYRAGRDHPQWAKFQELVEQTRKAEAKELGIPYVPYFYGPDDKDKPGYQKNKTADSKFGVYTFNAPRLDVNFQVEDTQFFDLPEEPEDIKVPNITEDEEPKRFFQQDINNLIGIGTQKDNLYLPFMQQLDDQKVDYVLDDYQGRVGAGVAALNTFANALVAAGGPQALVRSDAFGKTLQNTASAIGDVNQRNVNTINRVAVQQANLDSTIDRLNAGLSSQFYDDTQATLQNADNFINQKNAKFNELFNAAQTNASNAYNMNLLYPDYNIRPDLYGDVEFTERGRQFYKAPQADRLNTFYNRVQDYKKQTGYDMPEKTQQLLYNQMVAGAPPQGYPGMTQGQASLQNQGLPQSPYGYVDTDINTSEESGDGREMKSKNKGLKRYAFPPAFYTGKMGA